MTEYEGREPIHDVAQLAHVEILTPKPDETLWFFKELLALEETERDGHSVYLRAYEDFYHSTLKVTEAPEASMEHCAWRATSQAALERREESIESSGLGKGWIEGDLGHGPTYQFETPEGHKMEIFWEVEYYEPPEEKKSILVNRPQKKPLRGVPVRRLDHVNLMAENVTPNKEFMEEHLGFRLRENVVFEDGTEGGAWLSVSPLVHEVAFMADQTGSRGRFHHLCYWYDIPQHTSDLAEVLRENGIKIEAGPGKHGISQALFMYVFEPGGNRVELFGDAGYLILDPDWKPATWKGEEIETGIIFYGSPLPGEYFMYGTPALEGQEPEGVDEMQRVLQEAAGGA